MKEWAGFILHSLILYRIIFRQEEGEESDVNAEKEEEEEKEEEDEEEEEEDKRVVEQLAVPITEEELKIKRERLERASKRWELSCWSLYNWWFVNILITNGLSIFW